MINVVLFLLLFCQTSCVAYYLIKKKLSIRPAKIYNHSRGKIDAAIEAAAQVMLSSNRVRMSFSDDDDLYALLSAFKNRIIGSKRFKEYAYFNFPLAFLLIGFLDLYKSSHDSTHLHRVEKKCEEFLDLQGRVKFNFDKIDQSVFGLLFLRLYEITGSDRYLNGAHDVYGKLSRFKSSINDLYLYRIGLEVFFIDSVGLVCPFLVRYAEISGNEQALAAAKRQLDFAIVHCVEKGRGLAFHAFDMKKKVPLGSANWARGMGWYLIGLVSIVACGSESRYSDALSRSVLVLDDLRLGSGFWPQFLGHTNDSQIDSSATLMFLHAFHLAGVQPIDSDGFISLVNQCVEPNGRVVMSSGDTIYINKYSRVKGSSELSQGLMLSVIADMQR